MSDKEELQKKPKKKRLSLIKIFWLFLLAVTLFLFTPLPSYLISLIPEKTIRNIMSDYYQDITIEQDESEISAPLKYAQNAPYPVLGRDSGICFHFYSTQKSPDDKRINAKRLKGAYHNKPIAEIIAVDNENKEYTLKETTLNTGETPRTENNEPRAFSIICQKFDKGNENTLLPSQIKALYVRPLLPFTPYKITWVTRKEL